MSHVTTIDLEIRDLDALRKAASRLGMELMEGQQTYRWYGESVGDYPLPDGFTAEDLGKCDHALRVCDSAEAYEMGVVRRRDGRPGFVLLWDFFQGGYGLENCVGKDGNRLKQAYATTVATKEALRQGFRVQEHQLENGKIELNLLKA